MGESNDTDRATGKPLAAYKHLREIALAEYPGLVSDAIIERGPGDAPRNLRVLLVDDGFLDVWLSEEKYSFHWQSDDGFVRFDNAPHHPHVDSHPHHRHVGDHVTSSPLEGDRSADFRAVMDYLERELLS